MPKKILVVDDEPDILKVVVFRLKKKGFDILTAIDGQEALDVARKERPDIILLDLRLPVKDGYQVCKEIKADEDLKSIPVIILTASSSVQIQEKLKELQPEDYMVKPFDPELLIEKVEQLLVK